MLLLVDEMDGQLWCCCRRVRDWNSHWDVDELDEVTDEAHDSEADSDGFADLDEF